MVGKWFKISYIISQVLIWTGIVCVFIAVAGQTIYGYTLNNRWQFWFYDWHWSAKFYYGFVIMWIGNVIETLALEDYEQKTGERFYDVCKRQKKQHKQAKRERRNSTD